MDADPAGRTARCVVERCPSPRQTTVVLRVEGTIATVDVCRRHAGAYAALVEARAVPA